MGNLFKNFKSIQKDRINTAKESSIAPKIRADSTDARGEAIQEIVCLIKEAKDVFKEDIKELLKDLDERNVSMTLRH
jgi:hypothetical protein